MGETGKEEKARSDGMPWAGEGIELALRGQEGHPVGQLRPEGTEVEGVLPEAGSSSTDNEGLSVTHRMRS